MQEAFGVMMTVAFDRHLLDIALGGLIIVLLTGLANGITNINGNSFTVRCLFALSTVAFQEDVADGSEVYVAGNLERVFTSNHAPEFSNEFSYRLRLVFLVIIAFTFRWRHCRSACLC